MNSKPVIVTQDIIYKSAQNGIHATILDKIRREIEIQVHEREGRRARKKWEAIVFLPDDKTRWAVACKEMDTYIRITKAPRQTQKKKGR